MEAAKRAALANMHGFEAGGGGGGSAFTGRGKKAPPAASAGRKDDGKGGKGAGAAGGDLFDPAAKERRAARFAPAERGRSAATAAAAAAAEEEDDDAAWDRMKGEALVGHCETMCPRAEMLRREGDSDLLTFERENPQQQPWTTNPELAVKKYTRSVELSLQPCDVRPLPTLQRSMAHLLRIADKSADELLMYGPSVSFADVQKFLWDRMRSIRQDLSLQHLLGALRLDGRAA